VADIPEIADIARRHGKTPAQVSIRWILQHGVTTIPKSIHPERIAENADVFDFVLSEAEMRTIDGLDKGKGLSPGVDTVVRFGWATRPMRPSR
jgi:methylglyoxal/glyoxal reductase